MRVRCMMYKTQRNIVFNCQMSKSQMLWSGLCTLKNWKEETLCFWTATKHLTWVWRQFQWQTWQSFWKIVWKQLFFVNASSITEICMDISYSTKTNTMCGQMIKHCKITHPTEDWWYQICPIVVNTITDHRNNCMKAMQKQFSGTWVCAKCSLQSLKKSYWQLNTQYR